MPGDLLTWPDVGGGHITFGVAFLAGVLLVFFLTRWIYIRAGRRDARWSVLMQYALRHRVRGDDLKLLRGFFDSLSGDETLQVTSDRRFFHSKLHDYLLAMEPVGRSSRELRRRVRVFDSLFPNADFQLEIKTLHDVQPGEVCSLEFEAGQDPRLATVLRRKDDVDEIWIGVPDWHPPPNNGAIGATARLYVYRPAVGGFLIEGRILRAGRETVVFGEAGRIQASGNQHLMAEIEAPLTLSPWPPAPPVHLESTDADAADIQESAEAAEAGQAEVSPEEVPASESPVQIEGVTKLISDRAILFFTEDQAESRSFRLLEGQEVWEIDLVLPRGFALRCRGIVLPSRQGGGGRWLFKYLDATEGQRRALFEEIKAAGARRERLV